MVLLSFGNIKVIICPTILFFFINHSAYQLNQSISL